MSFSDSVIPYKFLEGIIKDNYIYILELCEVVFVNVRDFVSPYTFVKL